MFTEIKPLLENTIIKITISSVTDGKLFVMVEPTHKKAAKEIAGLIPLGLTATAEELDEQLSAILTSYTNKSVSLLDQYESQIAEMERVAKEDKVNARTSPIMKTSAIPKTAAATTTSPAAVAKEAMKEDSLSLF